jgi:hypothetical protein
MSLHQLANQMQKRGRGKDTMLVHMSPREVGGLQTLAKAAGGSLTINPDTGLPEAGFLEQVLPVVAAAGLTYLTAGAATPALAAALGPTAGGIVAGAGAGALISGATAAATGRNAGQAALMGGLGGAIAGGTGAYADTPTSGMFPPSAPAAAPAAPTVDIAGNALSVPNPAGPGFISSETGQAVANAPVGPRLNLGDVEAQAGGFYGGAAPVNPYANMTNAQITHATGIQPPPPAAPSYFQEANKLTKAGILALPGLGAAYGYDAVPMPGQEQYDENSPYRMRLSRNFQGATPVQPNPYYRAQYAAGGIANASYPQAGIDRTQYAVPSQMPTSAEVINADYDAKTNPYTGMARGGVADLGGYSDGGRMLKGPGDGMSDSIPGVIGGKQPARLADGEFVVPADVVSHLGNGSTDAGAKKLYAMMDRIRQARTGKKKQAPAIKTDKYLPKMA